MSASRRAPISGTLDSRAERCCWTAAIENGVPVLVVEGTIVNGVASPVDVPRLRFALRNAAGAEVYAWTAVPTQTVIEPGAQLPFRSRLASPPDDGHDVQVRFFTRRDVVVGLH